MDRPFSDPALKPTESAIESTIGQSFDRYQSVLALASSFSREWNFSRGSGWMLKIHDGKKALLYLIPLAGRFKISMAIRETERDALQADQQLAELHAKLASAKKYSEGLALQFDIDEAADFAVVASFLSRLIAVRR
ncbi:MAG TPA: DUF3788 family protein [Candidatus Limnocylindrales bacterium]